MTESNAQDTLQQLLETLEKQQTNEKQVDVLQKIEKTLEALLSESETGEIMQASNIVQILSQILQNNMEKWVKDKVPKWINSLISNLYECTLWQFPIEQFKTLVAICSEYIRRESWEMLDAVTNLTLSSEIQDFVFSDNNFYNMIKKSLALNKSDVTQVYSVFRNLTSAHEGWQLKMIQDKQLIHDLLLLPDCDDYWGLFVNLSQHPDAKTLLPKELLNKAIQGTDEQCTDICALLCSEDSLSSIKLNELWMQHTASELEKLMSGAIAERFTTQHNLLDFILPIANLSSVERNKDVLGRKVIPLLLRVVTEDLPDIPDIQECLPRARQEAAKALWNFAFMESNRDLISKANGISKLSSALHHSDDPIVTKNIKGILHMFAPVSAPSPASVGGTNGHVMISYNWDNQPIVKRIAASLKAHGYTVWLDIEQMGGSTLAAMADAIERSALILMCMTQKYHDSPNCRLEGEYCINRRVPFIPLMMQPAYRATGWLGIALGSKLYHAFFDQEDWDMKIGNLVREMGDRGKAEAGVVVQVPAQALPVAHTTVKSPRDWTDEEMHAWMKTEGIEHHSLLFKKHKFDGRALLVLKSLLSPSQPAFFTFVMEQLQICELGEMLRLFDAIHKLP